MLLLSPAVAIWKDGRVSIEITSLSKIARSTSRGCTNLNGVDATFCHTPKFKINLKEFAKDKHASLFYSTVNDEETKGYVRLVPVKILHYFLSQICYTNIFNFL